MTDHDPYPPDREDIDNYVQTAEPELEINISESDSLLGQHTHCLIRVIENKTEVKQCLYLTDEQVERLRGLLHCYTLAKPTY